MKKFYTIIVLVLSFSLSFSQTIFPEPSEISSKSFKSKILMNSINKSTPFWSEDFSGGIPATWINASTSIPDPSISAPWVFSGPGTYPGVNTGSQGAYAWTQGPIASSTASNGFVIFDSDYYDNGDYYYHWNIF